jgi:predicted nucleic acid-binding protein
MPDKVFIDSDVVISALLSQNGAAHLLLVHYGQQIERFISNVSKVELRVVCRRLYIPLPQLDQFIRHSLAVTELNESAVPKFDGFVIDPGDAHIIAGAVESKSSFLISYNLKHYRINAIRSEMDIVVMTPANFLQYLRSK